MRTIVIALALLVVASAAGAKGIRKVEKTIPGSYIVVLKQGAARLPGASFVAGPTVRNTTSGRGRRPSPFFVRREPSSI
jgi:hypothetical protein